VYVTDLR